MPDIDFQLGGGYAYQWQCGILLALNSFFEEPVADVRFDKLVTRFLGQVDAVHLEGEDRERDIELEDLNLLGAAAGTMRRIGAWSGNRTYRAGRRHWEPLRANAWTDKEYKHGKEEVTWTRLSCLVTLWVMQ